LNSTDPATATVTRAARLRADLVLPGDKSISHRALLFAALATGDSLISDAGDGADVRSTAAIVAALGVDIERVREADGRVDYRIRSGGARALREPDGILDCGNSGTSLRLVAGLLAGLPMTCVLTGDDSLRRRPVARIIEPLRRMGAVLYARHDDTLPPLTVVGHTPLAAMDYSTPVPSAQVKSAILLAALQAEGRTIVRERIATRDHTERMLRARGVPVERDDVDRQVTWAVEGGVAVRAIDQRVPGDVSAASFWLVAGSIHPDAHLTMRSVGVNPTRRAAIDILRTMGARIEERPVGTPLDDDDVGEPSADLAVHSSELRAIELGPGDVAAAIDEIPVLCLAATQATGTTTFRGAGELRHKESDRISGIVDGLGAMGARITADGDDLRIEGPTTLHGATTDSLDDHRLAMTFAIAGLVADGRTVIGRPGSAAISYPTFFDDLQGVRA
jgi:3-phosphoshikimate 1-carboxyvinyltransferase